jgi:hypothetical protein
VQCTQNFWAYHLQVPTATSRLRTVPALVLSLLALWLATAAVDYSSMAESSRQSGLMFSPTGTAHSFQGPAEIPVVDRDASAVRHTHMAWWAHLRSRTAPGDVRWRDAALSPQAQPTVTGTAGVWLKTSISAAAAASIVVCLVLLKVKLQVSSC